MVKLGEASLIWLLQVFIHRIYSLLDDIGALPASGELAAHVWEEQEHMVTGLKLLGLGWLVADALLLPLGHLHILLYDMGHLL